VHPVLLLKPAAEFLNELSGNDFFLLPRVGENLFEFADRVVNQGLRDDEPLYICGWQLEFDLAEDALANRHQPARAGLLVTGLFGYPLQTVIAEKNFDSVCREILLVLTNDAAFGILKDEEEILYFQRMTNYTDRQPPDEFRLETELDEILRLTLREDLFGRLQWGPFGCESDGRRSEPLPDYFLQAAERAADDEQDVFGVDRGSLLCRWVNAPALRSLPSISRGSFGRPVRSHHGLKRSKPRQSCPPHQCK
jgi:hypothetical protein